MQREKLEKMYYNDNNQKLGLSEFTDTFENLLDSVVVTSKVHLENNKNFYDTVIFKLFDLYQRESSNYSVRDMVTMFHIFLHSMFTHKPSVEKDDDIIKLEY